MTKLKTKKGKPIAKRTLSVILAAAMVLSSNSLVWANADVEPQAEVAAVAEESVVEDNVVVADAEYTSDIAIAETDWNDENIEVTGSVKKDGVAIPVNYVWQNAQGEALPDASGSGTTIASYAKGSDKTTCGKTYQLLVYAQNEYGDEIFRETHSVTVEKFNVNNGVNTYGLKFTNATVDYTGKTQQQKPEGVLVNGADSTDLLADSLTYSYNGDLVNVGTVEVTGTIKDSDPYYTGTISGSYEIEKADAFVDVTADFVSGKNVVEYTGSPINSVSADDVILKDKDGNQILTTDEKNPVSRVKFVKGGVAASVENVGDTANAQAVVSKTTSLENYDLQADQFVAINQEVSVAQLDLSTCEISVDPVQASTSAIDPKTLNVNIYKDGEKLNIDKSEYTITCNTTIQNAGIYDITITPAQGDAGKNLKGSVTGDLTVQGSAVFNNATIADKASQDIAKKAEYYTGSQITKVFPAGLQVTAEVNGVRKVLEANEYKIEFGKNVNAGKGQIYIVGQGSYLGSRTTIEFDILKLDGKVSADESVIYNEKITDAKDYEVNPVVTAENPETKEVKTLVEGTDYKVLKSEFTSDKGSTVGANEVNNYVKTTIEFLNKNYEGAKAVDTAYTRITKNEINDSDIQLVKDTYTYTGKAIVPEYKVIVAGKELEKNVDYKETLVANTEVGTATLEIRGIEGKFDTEKVAKATFKIVKAKAEDLEVKVSGTYVYNGKAHKPEAANIEVKLAGNKLTTADFDITYGENINAGKEAGTIVLSPKSEKMKASIEGTKTVVFEIEKKVLQGKLKFIDKNGQEVKDKEFDYTGNPIEYYRAIFTQNSEDKIDVEVKEGVDYQIKYIDNVLPGTAKVYVEAIGNNYKGIEWTMNGVLYENVVRYSECSFTIKPYAVTKATTRVETSAEYAEGKVVVPTAEVVADGKTLVEGKDFKVVSENNATEVGKGYNALVEGINGYTGYYFGKTFAADWKTKFVYEIVAKDLANCVVNATANEVTVLNEGSVVSPSEYDVKDNGDGTVTVTAKATSKNYKGSATAEIVESSNQVLDVVAKPYTKTKIHVTWRNIKGADSYVIYKDGVKIAEAEDGKEGYIDGGMHSYDGIYEYQVAAVFNGKEGEKSDVYESTTRPADPVVNNAFTHKNGIRVETKAKGAEGYRVWIRQGGSNPTEYVEKKSTYGNYTFKDLKNGQKYVIKVQAYKLVNGKKVPSRKAVYVTGRAETAKKSLI